MVNEQLVNFIREQQKNGMPIETITKMLLEQGGWTQEDVNSALITINSTPTQQFTKQRSPSRSITKIAVIILIIFAITGGGVFAYFKFINPSITKDSNNIVNENSNATIQEIAVTQTPVSTSTKSTTESEPKTSNDLWSLLDKSGEALKNKDAVAYNSVTYTQVKPDEVSQFALISPLLYESHKKINKADYVNKLQDDKQAIYYTNPKREDSASFYSYTQGQIMFINDKGVWKILLTSPDIGWNMSKAGTSRNPDEIEKYLQSMMLDSDKDGITDLDEKCEGPEGADPKCTKTDPNNKDSNGNGLWDGIDKNINQ